MNHIVLMGNLTDAPEVKHTNSGTAICSFTLAHNKRWKTEAGEQKEKVSFIKCVMFGQRAESFAKYHRKGSKALVEGEITQETWEDKETKKKRERTLIQVHNWEFVGERQGDGKQEQRQQAPQAPKAAQQPQDDVPF